MEWGFVFYMEVGFRQVYISAYNLSFCLCLANIEAYKKPMLVLVFVVHVFVERLCV
jgi:hypothetical protein